MVSFHQYMHLSIYMLIQFLSAQIESKDVNNNNNILSSETTTKLCDDESNVLRRVSRPCMCGLLRDREKPKESATMISSKRILCSNGFTNTVNDSYPCKNIDLLSFMPLKILNRGGVIEDANDIWGWTHPDTKREYAIIGIKSGTAFVDVTDPVNPVFIGKLPLRKGGKSKWGDVKTYGNYAFIVSEYWDQGVQIFDLTTLDQVTPGSELKQTAHYNRFGSSHNIAINEKTGFAYVVGTVFTCRGGLNIIDIRDPLNATKAGCFNRDGYIHDAQCVIYDGPDAAYSGKEICFTFNEDTVNIIDVTDKENKVELSRTSYNNVRYTHQGWLTEDHKYLFIGDELDEKGLGSQTTTFVINVESLSNPYLTGEHIGSTFATDHNQYVKGDYLYQANYRAGLRILQIQDLSEAKLEEVGYFDFHTGADSPGFNGAWSVYPFFESGTIIVSVIEQGLFVLRYKAGRTNPTESASTKPPSSSLCMCSKYKNPILCTGDVSDCCIWITKKKGRKKGGCKVKRSRTTEDICNAAGSNWRSCKKASRCCELKEGKCTLKTSDARCSMRVTNT